MPQPTPEFHFGKFRETGSKEDLATALDLVAADLLKEAKHRTKNREEAADLVQATLLTAIESGQRFEAGAPLLPWLRGILLNHARNWRRAELRTKRGETREAIAPSGEPDPSDVAHRRLVLAKVQVQVQRLPAPYREVLELYVNRNWDTAQIAKHLDRPLNTVQTQLGRGLKKLRDGLPPSIAISAIVYLAVRAGQEPDTTESAEPTRVARTGSRAMLAVAALLIVAALSVLTFNLFADDVSATPSERRNTASFEGTPAKAPGVAREVAERKPAPDDGSAVIRLRWKTTNEPAVGVSVRLNPRHVPGTRFVLGVFPKWRVAWSNDQGEIKFDKVPAGAAQVFADDVDQHKTFAIHAGRTVTTDFVLEPHGQCRGTVVGPDGTPIADAEVWISSRWSIGSPGYLAGYTKIDGSFQLPYYRDNSIVWARKDGFAASGFRRLKKDQLGDQIGHTQLELGPDPAAISGVVLRQNGKPLPNAVVCSTIPFRGRPLTPMFYAIADQHGRFRLDNLRPGPTFFLLAGHRDGFAATQLPDVKLAPSETT